jgi:hypothetical protein
MIVAYPLALLALLMLVLFDIAARPHRSDRWIVNRMPVLPGHIGLRRAP